MDLALKQRLVGAIVLVALGVIFIPMLLDGSVEQPGHDMDVRIPDPPDGRIETRKLPLQPGLEADEPQADSQTPPAETTEPVIVSETQSSTPLPEPRAVDRAPDETEPASEAASSGWGLQLGMFGNPDNARGLVQRLESAGFSAYSEPARVGERVLQRVRMGPWRSRDEAVEAADRLGRQFPDVEISLQAVGPAGEASEESAETAAGWMVQVGSFSSEENARSLRDELRAAGFVAHSDRIAIDGKVRYRVQVGPEIDRAAAEALQLRLRQEMNINSLVVSHP